MNIICASFRFLFRCFGVVVIVLTTAVAGAHAGKQVEGVVNLNTATAAELELLPGIGPAKVKAILAYRQAQPFRTPEELVRIKGIGRKMVRRLRPHLAVSGPTTARAAATRLPETSSGAR